MNRKYFYRKYTIIFIAALLTMASVMNGFAIFNLPKEKMIHISISTITVDNDGDGDYRTINAALRHAKFYDIIEVYSGRYRETITIDKQITLRGVPKELGSGSDQGMPIIDGRYRGSVITTTGDGVEIDGFRIIKSKKGCAGIHLSSHYNIITNNEIMYNYYGLKLYPSTGNIIDFNTINKNQVEGIWLCHSLENTITNNIIANNENGISASMLSHSNRIEKNVIIENRESGIDIAETSFGSIILMNNISKNAVGIRTIGSSDNNQIYKNNLMGNKQNAFDSSKNQYFFENAGNHWSDYTGIDTNGDGIGDTPYMVPGSGNNKDDYPFIAPLLFNNKPNKPEIPTGRTNLKVRFPNIYSAMITDPDGGSVYCIFNWGDGSSDRVGPKKSGESFIAIHKWTLKGSYEIKVQGYDGFEYGPWSDSLNISVQK